MFDIPATYASMQRGTTHHFQLNWATITKKSDSKSDHEKVGGATLATPNAAEIKIGV